MPSVGRHSLGTSDHAEALRRVNQLDRRRAADMGLIPLTPDRTDCVPLLLIRGRELYEQHVARPRVAGGVRPSTRKKYRAVFDKFVPFAQSVGLNAWNAVDAAVLTKYAADLESKDYAHKSLQNELITLKQAIRWMIQQGHLTGVKPIELKLRKAESESAYCYRAVEVRAMIERCREVAAIEWLGDVIIALACTGLRIAELASLRWADIDLVNCRLNLTDETGHALRADRKRRELKSGRSRSFPVHPDLAKVLERLPRRDGYVFHGPRGGRLKPDTVRRILVREVITPLTGAFPTLPGTKGFSNGRLHSFRHAFCSTCANSGVPERMVMEWLGHADSAMVRWYYHLHDEEARRRMAKLDFLGGAGGRSAGKQCSPLKPEVPSQPNSGDVAADACE